MNVELRRFTREDWRAFAGAELLTDKSEPLIGEIGNEAVVIVSGESGSVAVEFFRGVELDACWRVSFPASIPATFLSILTFVNLLSEPTEENHAGWTRFA